MRKKSVFVLFAILILFSMFVSAANPYGNNILDSKKVPSSLGYHELRLVVNGSDLYSVDANENGIIDVAESVLGGGAYWLPAVLGIYYMGNAGIGEDDPQRKLHISASQDANIRLQDTDASDATAAYIEFYNETDRLGAIGIPGDNTSDYLVIATEKGKDIVMLPSGNVGIGTTNPTEKLTVNSDSGQGKIGISGVSDNGLTYSALYFYDDTADLNNAWVMGHRKMIGDIQENDFQIVRYITPSTPRLDMNIDSGTGNVGIGTTNPSNQLTVLGDAAIIGNDPAQNVLTLRRASAEQTGNILQWQKQGGVILGVIGPNGSVGIGTATPKAKLEIAGTDGTDLLALPGEMKLTYREGAGSLYGFNIFSLDNSFFLHTEEGGAQQALYFGDGNEPTNIFGISTKSISGTVYDWTARFVVNQNGNVGIGTTTPAGKLDVNGTICIKGNCIGNWSGLGGSDADWIINGNNMSSGVSGNVGIGTTNPRSYAALDINTTGSKSIYLMDSSNGGLLIGYQGSNIQARQTNDGNNQNLTLQQWGGNVGIGTTSPSAKLEVAGDLETDTLEDRDNTNFFDGLCTYGVQSIDSAGTFTCATNPDTTVNGCVGCLDIGSEVASGFSGDNIADNTIDASELEANSVGDSELIDSPTFTTVTATKVTNLAAPSANSDATNKAYVDAQVTGGSAFEITCGWITVGNPPTVGSCNPPACPTGYTTSNVGCEVTDLASGGMYDYYGQGGGGSPTFGVITSRKSPAGAGGKCQRVCFK